MSNFENVWKLNRKLQAYMFAWGFGGIAMIIPLDHLLNSYPSLNRTLVVFCYLGLCLFAVIYFRVRLGYFRCPRCGEYFETIGHPLLNGPKYPSKKCAHCGLKRYAAA